MSTTTKGSGGTAPDYRIPASSPWAGAWKIAGGVGAVCLIAAIFFYIKDPHRFAFSYLFAMFVPLSLALGSLFFVMVLYITKASWGVTVRRVAELFMRPIPVLAALFVPLVLLASQLFPWWSPKHAELVEKPIAAEHAGPMGSPTPLVDARGDSKKEPSAERELRVASPERMEKAAEASEDAIVTHKRFFLNRQFVFGRLIFYFVVWSMLAYRYFSWSTEQDKTKALETTAAAQKFTPIGLMLFAVSLSFFAFDWLLSLDATWYSTMFGVYIFAQCTLFQMAFLVLATLLLRHKGFLGDAVTVEHFHDMGKLLFGWIVFWSYISFAQFFLTWYSNIPDEVAWFHKRWRDNGGTWIWLSLTLVVMHFFVPFWFLMSRNIKRRLPLLAIGASCMVVMHVLEVYWVVMPNIGPLAPNLGDLVCLVGVFGVYIAAVLRAMVAYPLVAVGDPRLSRALEFENA